MAILLSQDESADSWESLTESLCSIGKDATECFALDGYDVAYSILLYSDLDPNKIILATYIELDAVDVMEEFG